MQLPDIQTLRGDFGFSMEKEEVRWSNEHVQIALVPGPVWRGPFVRWALEGLESDERRRAISVAREGIRGALELAFDAGADAFEVSPDDVEHWKPARLGFVWGWALEKPGLWRLGSEALFGNTEEGLGGLVVSLSGGGLRATGFSLGVFTALEELGLLSSIRCVSSVSGGAMFAGAWTAARASGMRFDAFAAHLMGFMIGERKHGGAATHSPSLIRQFADLLSVQLLGGDAQGPWTLGRLPRSPEIMFQATELSRAGGFVFAVSDRATQGSPGKVELGPLAQQVRLADAVAASAAYPIGFEPFVFPRDFALSLETERAVVQRISEARTKGRWPADARDHIPLVDGGVFDNQGVQGARNAARRHPDAEVLLLADVAITDPERAVWVAGQLEPDASVLAGLAAGLVVLVSVGWLLTWLLPPWGVVLVVVGLAVTAMLAVPALVVEAVRTMLPPDISVRGLRSPTGFVHGVGLRLQIARLLLERVLLERLRSLRYRELFGGRPDLTTTLAHLQDLRRLREAGDHTIMGVLRDRYPLSGSVHEMARQAEAVPTVLHLQGDLEERRSTLKGVVETGRVTTLFSLLHMLHTSDRPRSATARALLEKIEGNLPGAGA